MPVTLVDHDPLFVAAVIALLGFTIGLVRGGFNALGVLLTPLLSLVLPVSLAVGVLLMMLIVGDLIALRACWREWDERLLGRMLPAGLAGAVIGTVLLAQLSSDALRLVLAVFVLSLAAYKLAGDRITRFQYQPRNWHGPAAGLLSGIASGMFNTGGPPFNAYLLLQKLPPRSYVATSVVFFAALNLLKIPGFLMAGVLDVSWLVSLWWVIVFIPLGLAAARWLILRVNQTAFEWIVVGLLFFSSAMLFWQSL